MANFINKEIIDFSVQAFHNGEFKKITRQDILGHWSVLFFYPADFSFICPTELIDLQDYYQQFQSENCEIYSISEDTHFVHKAWVNSSESLSKISYPMLSDSASVLARSLEVLDENIGQAFRSTFIISPEGKIKAYEINDMGISRNAEELLRKVQTAKFALEHGDEMCPAKWKPGEETIKLNLDLSGLL